MKIYPMPYKYEETGSFFVFSGDIEIKYNEEFPNARTLPLLAELWNNFTGGMHNVTFTKDSALALHTFSANGVKCVCESGFEHSISVTEDGFGAGAEEYKGLIHAFMTLLQAIQPERVDNEDFTKYHIACFSADDKPSISMRSFHISFLPGIITRLHQTIRMCALVKYSHILIEFFGTVQFDSFPELVFENAYSKEEVMNLLDEARALGLELIPMFNCFGHAALGDNQLGIHAVLNREPKMSALFEPDGWTYCASNPQTRRILKSLCHEIIEMCGEGSYLHIGGDEAHSYGTCDVCSKTPTEELYAGFINEMADEMKPLGRRVMVWGDSWLEHEKFGNIKDRYGRRHIASEGTSPRGPLVLDLLDKSVIICDWQYDVWDDNIRTSEYFTEKGFEVIPCSATEVINTDAMAKATRKHGYHGIMQTVWSKNFNPILITRGGTSSWMEDLTEIDKYERGEFWFVRGYMLMNHRSGDFMRKVLPSATYTYSVT